MGQSAGQKTLEVIDWDAIYRSGSPPWETGEVASELVRVLDERLIEPCSTIELGCGTGADAVHLAKQGFEVTGVDSSPLAIEQARHRARSAGVPVRFVLDDVFDFAQTAGQFDLIYDAGFYHSIRGVDLSRFLDMLWRITRPGSLYLALIGNTEEEAEGGPPQVAEHEIRFELTRLFDIVNLRPGRFESPNRQEGYLGWSCLMTRPGGPT